MPTIKVVSIIEEGRFGGPQKYILDVAARLKGTAVETVVLTSSIESDLFCTKLERQGTPYYTLPLHRITKDKAHLLKYALFFFYEIYLVYRFLKQERPDIVNCHDSHNIKGVIASKLAGIPNVWHIHNTFAPSYLMLLFSFVKLFADSFIAVSERTKEFYFPSEKKKVQVVQAPIDAAFFQKYSNSAQVLKESGIKIVTVGNVNPVKGHEVLLEAAHYVNEKSQEKITFYIVGKLLSNQTTHIDKLKQLQTTHKLQNVQFLGQRSDVKDILNEADIYVCSSHFEASPISVWEAMAMSRAVVSTDVGDVQEILAGNEAGIVVTTNQPEALAKAILQLIEEPHTRQKLGKQARKTVTEHLDIDICAKKHLEIYKTIFDDVHTRN